MQVKTIKVQADTELGYKLINESDFNKGEHKKFGAKKAKAKPVEEKKEEKEEKESIELKPDDAVLGQTNNKPSKRKGKSYG